MWKADFDFSKRSTQPILIMVNISQLDLTLRFSISSFRFLLGVSTEERGNRRRKTFILPAKTVFFSCMRGKTIATNLREEWEGENRPQAQPCVFHFSSEEGPGNILSSYSCSFVSFVSCISNTLLFKLIRYFPDKIAVDLFFLYSLTLLPF